MSGPEEKTALDLAIERDTKGDIPGALTAICARKGVRDEEAADAVGDAFRIAFQHERAGKHWDPTVQSATVHLGGILVNVLREMRRRKQKKPTRAFGEGEEGELVSHAEAADELLMVHEDKAVHAAAVRKSLAAQTSTGLTLRVLDALCAGVVGHQRLADELKCSLPQIRAAYKRMTSRLKAMQGQGDAS